MSNPTLKPWCQTEEGNESAAAAPTAAETASNMPPAETPSPDRPLAGSASDWRVMLAQRMTPLWAVTPLAFAAAWLIWVFAATPSARGGLPAFQVMGIVGLMIVAMGILALSRYARRNAVSQLLAMFQDKAGGLPRALESLPIPTELQPIWDGVQQHSANLEQRLSDLLDNQRQLMLEVTLAETQKRQATAVVNTMADPFLVIDAFDQLIQANAAAEELFGFSLKEHYRRPVGDVISDERLLRIIRKVREAGHRAAERRGEHEIGEKMFGSTIAPLAHVNDCEEEDAPDHGVVVVLRDITRQHAASKKKSDFVSHVAHELRTPLSSICAYVEMLVDGEANDEKTRGEFYEIIQSSADRLGRLIDNMLDISRIEAGTVRIKKESIAISLVVKEAIDMMRPSAEEKEITLTGNVTPVMYRMLADRDLIYQAVLNLLSNAIKYTPNGGEVIVRMTPREKNKIMLVEVSDTGIGIPEEDLPRMFEKFFRVPANKDVAKGTGLGLNLVKNIVETVHKGKMTLKSEVGRGSTFGMILPLMS